ncbi:hypothetical protein HJC04_11310 [Rhizobium sp. NLR8a]|uniref:hypothetical protein n=1 Tax=Rhizobium TaxID=379 RepID=UPI001C83A50D|nr:MULTISPECIES: hypothetical protein [Rhizobium]MBX5153216.1 hypothetical protein [Rhizobium lentis]MBX5220889.1 hypothetical protein [Rhizobium sp. NLR8a]
MAATRGRPIEYPIKKLIAINEEILDAVEAFRAAQQPQINQSEAFRRILREWLLSHGYLAK